MIYNKWQDGYSRRCPYVRPSGKYSINYCSLRHGHLWAGMPHEDTYFTKSGPWVRRQEISFNAENLAVWRGRLFGEMEECEMRRLRSNVEMNWLQKIEALQPGDKCEFHYAISKEWLPVTVVLNGSLFYWHVQDDSGGERHGQVCKGLQIEQVRLPGQVEAWPRVFEQRQQP